MVRLVSVQPSVPKVIEMSKLIFSSFQRGSRWDKRAGVKDTVERKPPVA
jgi:hypothetical protein